MTKHPLFQILFSKEYALVAICHLIAAFAALASPLAKILGFERAFLGAILGTIAGIYLGNKSAHLSKQTSTNQFTFFWVYSIILSFIALIPSITIGMVYEITFEPCAPVQGLLFFILLAGGNIITGNTLGYITGYFLPFRKISLTLAYIISAIIFLQSLTRLYNHPPVFVHSILWGFWPGSIYDEAVEITQALLGQRLLGFCISLSFFILALSFYNPRTKNFYFQSKKFALSVLLIIISSTIYNYRSEFGFSIDRKHIQQALYHKVETPNFTLYYSPKISTKTIKILTQEHEFRYQQLQEFFRIKPKQKITSYVFKDRQEKNRWMGAARTQIARPWANEIYIHEQFFPHPVLKHELAHIFAGYLSNHFLRVPTYWGIMPNMGLVEGIAVAADWPHRERSIHESSAAMQSLGILPNINKSFNAYDFWSQSSSRVYTAMGSFIRYLYDRYGHEKLAQLYNSNDFRSTYASDSSSLIQSWKEHLASLSLSDAQLRQAQHDYSYASIFQRTCARASASQRNKAYSLLTRDIKAAKPLFETLYKRHPSDPQPIIDLARQFVRTSTHSFAEAKVLTKKAIEAPGATAKSKARALELMGEIAWKEGNIPQAKQIFSEIAQMRLSTPSVRLQTIRLMILELPKSEQQNLRSYLARELGRDAALVHLLNSSISQKTTASRYLLARRLERSDVWGFSLSLLNDEDIDALPIPELRDASRLLKGRILFWGNKYEQAVRAFSDALKKAETSQAEHEAKDWKERNTFWLRHPYNTGRQH